MTIKAVVIGLAALGGLALTTGAASAMPNGLPQANEIAAQPAPVEQVRWVCGPWGRCVWRPNFYAAYGYYAPRRYWGWHRWHHWHRW